EVTQHLGGYVDACGGDVRSAPSHDELGDSREDVGPQGVSPVREAAADPATSVGRRLGESHCPSRRPLLVGAHEASSAAREVELPGYDQTNRAKALIPITPALMHRLCIERYRRGTAAAQPAGARDENVLRRFAVASCRFDH